MPLVADVHFDYRIAICAMENGADKVRINPGNIGDKNRIRSVVDAAKAHHIPIRVGANSGSLAEDYGKLPLCRRLWWKVRFPMSESWKIWDFMILSSR